MTDATLDLHGIIPPVSTPLTIDGEVAVDDLRNLLDFQLNAGVHGLFMLGSTSEAIGLTDAQQETVIATAIEHVAGRVPVLAGVIDFTTRRVIDRARRAAALGVDGLVSCAPFYIKPSQAEVVRHFEQIRAAIDLPVMAYDIPGAVQTKIERPTLRTLARSGAIVGMKDSSGQEANFRGVVLDNQDLPDFRIFTGSELMTDVALGFGAHGCVPGLGNVDPAGYVHLYKASRAGDAATVRAEQDRLFRLYSITKVATRPEIGHSAAAWGSFKVALKLRGIIQHAGPTAPMSPLTADEEVAIAAILEEAGLLAPAPAAIG
ncbi:MAG TPA: dihydrodipicolinate synthase family protein [Thermomicrobiales bacterium]|nr:dihydrodipicolinate synthase family protein [Thermomicrobiales bacterium]